MTQPKDNHKVYIGDGVYVDYNNYSFILSTRGSNIETNRIYIDPSVWKSLKLYVDKINKKEGETN